MHIIYGLQDPRDRLFFYIGITENVFKRFLEHIQCSGPNYEKNRKMLEMREQNVLPHLVELERVENIAFGRVREQYWIAHYEMLKHPLTNIEKLYKSKQYQKKMQNCIAKGDTPILTDAEIRKTIRRLFQINMSHRDISRAVGLSGRKYQLYQQICQEEGILTSQVKEEGINPHEGGED